MIIFRFNLLKGRIFCLMNFVLVYIHKDLSNNLEKYLYSNVLLFVGLFFFISISNFLGLFPYIFTPSRHLIISIGLCLPFWFSLIFKNIFVNTFKFFTHLVPLGTPLILAPFIVLIERVSLIIRPVTLSVRLSANIIAGHLLIVLLRSLIQLSINFYLVSLIPLYILFLLELGVAFIQAYVFIVLLSLYLNEVRF